MNENNTKTAAARLRELYPNYSLTTAIDLLIDRVERAEENIKKYRNEAISAKEKAYDFDKRYCDLLVENRKLKNSLKGKVNPTYLGYPVDPENPENCKVKLEELEKMNRCYFCGKECGETILTVNDKVLFQSELFRAYMCAECSEAVHSALILLRIVTKGQTFKGEGRIEK